MLNVRAFHPFFANYVRCIWCPRPLAHSLFKEWKISLSVVVKTSGNCLWLRILYTVSFTNTKRDL